MGYTTKKTNETRGQGLKKKTPTKVQSQSLPNTSRSHSYFMSTTEPCVVCNQSKEKHQKKKFYHLIA